MRSRVLIVLAALLGSGALIGVLGLVPSYYSMFKDIIRADQEENSIDIGEDGNSNFAFSAGNSEINLVKCWRSGNISCLFRVKGKKDADFEFESRTQLIASNLLSGKPAYFEVSGKSTNRRAAYVKLVKDYQVEIIMHIEQISGDFTHIAQIRISVLVDYKRYEQKIGPIDFNNEP